jgi:Domain of unknown function (DUF4145)
MFSQWLRRGKAGEPLPSAHDGPPDSYRPSGLCPRCDKQSSFDCSGSLPITFDGGILVSHGGASQLTFDERATGFVCRHCHQGFVVVESKWHGEYERRKHPNEYGEESWRGHHWWPVPGAVLHESVPEPVRDAYDEACKCLASGCPRAGAAMARCALEGIVIDQGETTGNLKAGLKNLATKGKLVASLAEWADQVRLLGNDAVHDLTISVPMADARQLVDFIAELTKYIYVLPHDLTKRLERKP